MSIAIIYIALLFILWILVPLVVGLVLLIIFRRKHRNSEAETASITDMNASVESKRPLAQILRDHRLCCGMTQELVAEKLDVSRQAVSKWENGTSEPSTANLIALAQLYGVDAGELLKDAQV